MDSHTTLAVWREAARFILEREGKDVDAIFGEFGVDPKATGRMDAIISAQIWQRIVEITDCQAIGILTAQRYFQPAGWGALGIAILCSNSVREALQRLESYSLILTDLANFSVTTEGDITRLVMSPLMGLEAIGNAATDFGMASLIMLLRTTSVDSLPLMRVELISPPPKDPTPYLDFFQCEVSFGSDQLSFEFSTAEIDTALPVRNPELAAHHDKLSSDYIKQFDSSLSMKVKYQIMRMLPGGNPTPEKVSQLLHCSSRSLNRKLREEGCNYRDLQAQVRKELAIDYLKRGERSVQEIAFLVGFSDHSTFTRAFTKWYGVSPSTYIEHLEDTAE